MNARELAHGLRRACRAPVSSLVAIGCLALGLAAATLAYAGVSGLLLRRSAVPAAETVQLLDLTLSAGGTRQRLRAWSYPAYVAARDAVAAEVTLHAVTLTPLSLTAGVGDDARRTAVEVVSPGYFGALGATLTLGNDIDEVGTGDDRRVWLSDATWHERFGADPAVLGRVVQLQGLPFVVAGVAAPRFRGLSEQAALWVPMRSAPAVTFARRLEGTHSYWHAVFAVADARSLDGRLPAAAAAVARRIEPRMGGVPARVDLGSTRWIDTRVEPALAAAIAGIAACAAIGVAIVTLNLVLLALARLELRRDELAIRSALGARRSDLFGAVAADIAVIFTPALVAAWGLARLGLLVLAGAAPSLRFGAASLADLELGPDAIALLFALAAAVLGATLLAPALAVRRATNAAAPKSRDGVRAGRAQRAIAAAQFALATALAIGAAVAGGAAWRAMNAPLGFDPNGVLSAQVSIPAALAPADGTAGFLARMDTAMSALPGVASAASAACIPIQGGCDNVTIEARPKGSSDEGTVALALVAGDYFRTLGIALRAGRVFDAHDDAAAAPVVVLSESAARRYFPAGDALGRRLGVSVGWPEQPEGATIVGIVADVLGTRLDEGAAPAVYVPSAQLSYDDNVLLLRAKPGIDAHRLSAGLARALAQVEPRLALFDTATMTQRFDDLTARRRVAALLISALAALAALLAGSGVFAVFALSVRRRRREFAVRMAVGASGASVRRGVLGESVALAVGAAVAGIALAALGAGALSSALPEIRAGGAGTYALVAAVMITIALAASWWPAREAARAEPMRLLARDASS